MRLEERRFLLLQCVALLLGARFVFERDLRLHELAARVALLNEVVRERVPPGLIVRVGAERFLERLRFGDGRFRCCLDVALLGLLLDELIRFGPRGRGVAGERLGLRLPGGADLTVASP